LVRFCRPIPGTKFEVNWAPKDERFISRFCYPHYMLKEIFEQPQTVRNALRGRVDYDGAMARFGGLNMSTAELRAVDRVVIAACGTSWHAGLVGGVFA
jgi:glucosamine 6-phosphate synthetase-like amidotransferase/phosphosugar isomerase protein